MQVQQVLRKHHICIQPSRLALLPARWTKAYYFLWHSELGGSHKTPLMQPVVSMSCYSWVPGACLATDLLFSESCPAGTMKVLPQFPSCPKWPEVWLSCGALPCCCPIPEFSSVCARARRTAPWHPCLVWDSQVSRCVAGIQR